MTPPARREEHDEVHYWPNTGRILAVHTEPDGAKIDDLRLVNTGCDSQHLAVTTARYAELVADRTPGAGLTAHHRDGTITTRRPTPPA